MRYRSLTRSRLSRDGATHQPDLAWLAAVALLSVFGLLMLASASSDYSFQRYGDAYRVVLRQLLAGGLPGLVLLGIFFVVDYHRWQRYQWWWLAVSWGLLALVFVPGLGQVRNGARSWLAFGPITFQPAEVIKLTALLTLAAWLAQTGYFRLRTFREGLLPFTLFTGVTLSLIAGQPDLGTLLVVGMILATTYFVAGAPFLHLGSLLAVAATGLVSVLLAGGYRTQRLLVFLNPSLDPQGTGYHITQAYLAIGSGGWFGRGLGKSHQKFAYLPEVSADSIFAVIAEELGFLVAVGLVALLAFVVLRTLRLARRAPDPFGRFLAAGVATWFGFQSFLNLAVISGLAPLTGLPLPFVSAGGTALAANLAAVGLLLNISKQTNN